MGATTPLIKAVKNATETVSIVMVGIIDPVRDGFVVSLARPGGNVTGLSPISGPEIVGKQLGLLKEVVPAISRVAVLMNPANPAHEPLVREAEAAGRALQLRTPLFAARNANDLESAFSAMTRDRADAILVVLDALFFTLRGRIVELAAANRLPAMYGFRAPVDDGGLVAYGANIREQWHRAASYVDPQGRQAG